MALFQLPEWKELGFWFQPHPSPCGTALGKSLTPNLLLVRCHPDRLPSERPTRGSWLTDAQGLRADVETEPEGFCG